MVEFPKDKGDQGFGFETNIPKGMSVVYWPTADIFDIKKSRRLSILGSILDDRLRKKIREELGDAYSPTAHNVPSDAYTDYGYLFAAVTVDPTQAESVEAVIKEIAAELGKGDTITQDELDRAKKPQITQIEEMRRTSRANDRTIAAFEMLTLRQMPVAAVADELGVSAHDVYLAKSRMAGKLREIVDRLDRAFEGET